MNKFLIGLIFGMIIAGGISIFLNNSTFEFVKKNLNFVDTHLISKPLKLNPDITIKENKNNNASANSSEQNYDFYNILKSKIDDTQTDDHDNNPHDKNQLFIQINNFHSDQEANTMVGQLALLGIDAILNKLDDNNYNVIIGPINNHQDLLKTTKILLDQKIHYSLIKR